MIVDLSHPIQTGMTVYPGDPQVSVDFGAGGAGPWRVSALRLGSHSGTHIDAPAHLAPGRLTIDVLPLDRFVGSGVIFHLPSLDDDAPIALEHLSPALPAPRPADFALLRTGVGSALGGRTLFAPPVSFARTGAGSRRRRLHSHRH